MVKEPINPHHDKKLNIQKRETSIIFFSCQSQVVKLKKARYLSFHNKASVFREFKRTTGYPQGQNVELWNG